MVKLVREMINIWMNNVHKQNKWLHIGKGVDSGHTGHLTIDGWIE